MGRKIAALLVVALAVLAPAVPAAAKGISKVTVTGAGLPAGGIHLSGADVEVIFGAGLFEQTKDAPPAQSGISRAELGPMYRITYRLAHFPGARRARVHQDFYPYAKGGAWTYTPPGQRAGEMCCPSAGWWAVSDDVVPALVAAGLPKRSPVAVKNTKSSARSEAPVGDGGSSVQWLVVAVAIALAAAALTTLAHRRVSVAGATRRLEVR